MAQVYIDLFSEEGYNKQMDLIKNGIHYTHLKCQQCSKKFEVIYRYRNDRKYCSKECSYLNLVELHRNNPEKTGFKKGKNNPAWIDGRHPQPYPRSLISKERIAGRLRPGLCEICNRPDSQMSFDHDHKTGKFRGWICHQCNHALGIVEDNPEILKKLIKYLKKFK